VVHQNREDEKNPSGFFEFLSIRFEPVFILEIHSADPRFVEVRLLPHFSSSRFENLADFAGVVRPCFGSLGPLTKHHGTHLFMALAE
jgi:hypothetical protein